MLNIDAFRKQASPAPASSKSRRGEPPRLAGLVRWVKSLLFPVFCLRCGREGDWLCQLCESFCPAVPIQRCIFCQTVSPFGETCAHCRRRHALDGLIVRGAYGLWVWRDLIRTWKYRGAEELGPRCIQHFRECFDRLPNADANSVVVPIPLARLRERERGFNQSASLAEAVGRHLSIPVATALSRVRETLPQAKLSPSQRLENVRQCFICQDSKFVQNRFCFLVDDIATTGATLDAAAQALKEAGASRVWGVALVRSDPDNR